MRKFKFLLKYSYRNLWRIPKRTMIMILSLALGTGFIIWDLNFANSGTKEVMKGFLIQYAGKYHITHSDYYDPINTKKFNNYKTISDSNLIDKSLLLHSTPRVTTPLFISSEKKSLGILLTGIDIKREQELNTLTDALTVGRFLDPTRNKEVIIGKRLAEKLNVKIGDEVAVIGQAVDGSVANDLLVIVGLLDFGGGDLEDSLAFTQINTARELIVLPNDEYHQRVSFDMDAEVIPKQQGLAITAWDDILPEVGVAAKFVDNFTWVVSIIIVVVISLGLSNTLMVMFFEREKEFQSLNIIGAKTSWITLSLMLEVFIMGIIGLLIGCTLGHLATLLCSVYPINLEIFTGGKAIIMGGMTIEPLIRFYPVYDYYWKVPLMVLFFLSLTIIYPLYRVIQRSKHAV